MVDADELLAAGLRAGRRLDQDLGDLIKLRRKLVPVLRETRGPFDDLADGGRGKVEPALARDEARDELRDLILALGGARHLRVKLGLYLKNLLELGVIYIEQIVKVGGAYDHHLHINRYRLRTQRGYRYITELLAEILYRELTVAQDSLQHIPGHKLAQQLVGVQQQEAAVRAVHRAGGDAAEIRIKIPLPVFIIHLAYEVIVNGVRLADHGSAVVRIIGDEGVHLIAGEVYLGGVVAHGGEEYVEIGDKILRELVEPLRELLVGHVLAAQLRKDGRDRHPADLALQLLDLLLELLFPLADETQLLQRLLRNLLGDLLQRLLLRLRELFKLLLLHLAADELFFSLFVLFLGFALSLFV